MKAMILAAGLGTRLKPLTDRIPKALVKVEGVPMLARVITSLKKQGFDYIVINVHHFSNQIKEYLKSNKFGVEIEISDESNELLDTGGGIANAYPLLFDKDDQPVLIHNVDILSNADLSDLMQKAVNFQLGTLLVSERPSNRRLIFTKNMELKGWHDIKSGKYLPEGLRSDIAQKEFAFSGIYVMTKTEVEEMIGCRGCSKYSIMDYFLSPERKQVIKGINQPGLRLLDIGKPATLLQAPDLLKDADI